MDIILPNVRYCLAGNRPSLYTLEIGTSAIARRGTASAETIKFGRYGSSGGEGVGSSCCSSTITASGRGRPKRKLLSLLLRKRRNILSGGTFSKSDETAKIVSLEKDFKEENVLTLLGRGGRLGDFETITEEGIGDALIKEIKFSHKSLTDKG